MTRLLLDNDFNGACAYLLDQVDSGDSLERCLQLFIANLTAKLLPVEVVAEYQSDDGTIFSAIAQILMHYGGRDLLLYNGIVNSALILLSILLTHCTNHLQFYLHSVDSIGNDTLLFLWRSLLFVFDNCCKTYSENRSLFNRSGPPEYIQDFDVNFFLINSLTDDDRCLIANTTQLAVFNMSVLIATEPVAQELKTDYAIESIMAFFEMYGDNHILMGMFYYAYAHSLTQSKVDIWIPQIVDILKNSNMSILVAHQITTHLREYAEVYIVEGFDE